VSKRWPLVNSSPIEITSAIMGILASRWEAPIVAFRGRAANRHFFLAGERLVPETAIGSGSASVTEAPIVGSSASVLRAATSSLNKGAHSRALQQILAWTFFEIVLTIAIRSQ
jgi:hypothetical protein